MNHIVKSGETLTQIARDYRLSLSALLQANSGINPNIINPGQIIIIPGLPSPKVFRFK